MKPSLDIIFAAVESVVGRGKLRKHCRQYECVRARWLFFWVARRRDYSLMRIARFFGLDHTTVLHGCERMHALLEAGEHNEELRAIEDVLLAKVAHVGPCSELLLRPVVVSKVKRKERRP